MIDRRHMLAMLGSGFLAANAMPVWARSRAWPLTSGFRAIDQRHLWVRQTGRSEVLHTRFRKTDADPDWDGVNALSWLFRDWKAGNQGVVINISLLDVLATMQTVISLVEERPVEIRLNSGFRAPERNATLEGAAIHSHHVYGRAADIVMPGIPHANVRNAAEIAGAGGIGTYPRFTHVDVGPGGRRW